MSSRGGWIRRPLAEPDQYAGAAFYRPRDDAAVSVRFGAVTSVVVSTGCHRGSAFEDWPDGADVVPDRLRTTGRAPAAGGGRWNGR